MPPARGVETSLRFLRITRLAIASAVLVGACTLVLFLAMGDLDQDIATLKVLETDNPVSTEEIELNRFRLRWLVVLVGGLSGGAAVLWLAWQYTSHDLLRRLGVPGLRFGPAAGVGAWLVPGVNLFLPPMAMREIWRASEPFPPEGGWRRGRSGPVLWAWWPAFLGAIALAVRALEPAAHPGATFAERILRDQQLKQACWAATLAGILAVVLVIMIWRRQVELDNALRSRVSGT